jgi:O-antigen/teichoic acid export membrane protein
MALARLLTPTQFGIFSLVTIALGLTESLTQTGVNVTLLQSPNPVTYYLDSAWVIAIGRGFIIGIVMVILGFGMSKWYQVPELFFLVTVAALVPVIKGFINPSIIEMHKNLDFFSDTLYRISLIVVDASLAVSLVFFHQDLVMWILAMVGTAVFEVIISFAFFKNRPKFYYAAERGGEILRQAKGLGLSSLSSYLNDNVDNVLVGKLNGTYALGLYQSSYGLSHEANYEISKSIHHSSLPIFSKLREEPARLYKAFLKTMGTAICLMVVVSLPFIVFPSLVIDIIFDEKWVAATPLLPWLTAAGVLHGIGLICYSLLLAEKRVAAMNKHLILSFIAMLTLMYFLGSSSGVIGAVIGLAIARLITLPYLALQIWKTLRLIRQRQHA